MNEQRIEVLDAAYELIDDFLSRLGKGDYTYIGEKYCVSDAVAGEIRGYLSLNLDKDFSEISPPPRGIAFSVNGSRTPFVAYGEDGESSCWRVECLLWVDGLESEITAYFDLFKDGGKFRIEYLYLGS